MKKSYIIFSGASRLFIVALITFFISMGWIVAPISAISATLLGSLLVLPTLPYKKDEATAKKGYKLIDILLLSVVLALSIIFMIILSLNEISKNVLFIILVSTIINLIIRLISPKELRQ
ncbi:MAG: hypothetical protein FWE43_03125 [Streptococcaceae bacterium]|nr:hypothetical protein [Streptococcaceae bacterium]MCL2681456.1 hypothetical protein [Streptococcaceae bacterium]